MSRILDVETPLARPCPQVTRPAPPASPATPVNLSPSRVDCRGPHEKTPGVNRGPSRAAPRYAPSTSCAKRGQWRAWGIRLPARMKDAYDTESPVARAISRAENLSRCGAMSR